MLLAVEGGGFFSSSATGYSKGLTLLLLGRKNEEKPMRVSPWNQYQLVEQETDTDFQLASGKNRVSHGCAAFICFGGASPGFEGASPPKVGPMQQQDLLTKPSISNEAEDCVSDNGETENRGNVHLKSSLKKPSDCAPTVPSKDLQGVSGENESNSSACAQRRRVQWTDACGKDLVEIREFELRDPRSLARLYPPVTVYHSPNYRVPITKILEIFEENQTYRLIKNHLMLSTT